MVSEKHANFLVHEGGGTAAEARALLTRIAETVQETFDVSLHRELVVWAEPCA